MKKNSLKKRFDEISDLIDSKVKEFVENPFKSSMVSPTSVPVMNAPLSLSTCLDYRDWETDRKSVV